ncbi:MAG: hypothetical protein GY719_13710 [bacterium]|nr:hypothetical protein [bacterium]
MGKSWFRLTAHLTLICLLPVVAGQAWSEELQRAASLRCVHGQPSTFEALAARLPAGGQLRDRLRSAGVGTGSMAVAAWRTLKDSGGWPASGIVGDLGRSAAPAAGASPRPATTGAPERRAVPPVPRLPAGSRALDPGSPPWHLLSVPDAPDDVDPAVLLPIVDGDFTLVYAYDACDAVSPWRVYDPADPAASDLAAVDERLGFWLKGTDPEPLAVAGTEPAETQVQLCQGWNLIGYPLAQERPVLAALSSIHGKFLRVYGFDPSVPAAQWSVYDVGVPDWANTLRTMERGKGYWVWATEDATLILRNVGPPPEVAIASPQEAQVVRGFTDVVGSVRSDLLERWELAYRLKGDAAWTTFATGDTPVIDDFLGVFDPTLLVNGFYEIRLEAMDFQQRSAAVTVDVIVEGRLKVGHFSLSFIDLDVPVVGLPIQVMRTYDTRDLRPGDFGAGWTLDLTNARLQETEPLGTKWDGFRSPGAFPTYCVNPMREHRVTITLPDDTVLRFRPTVTPRCQPLVPQQVVTVGYEPLPGTFASLRTLDQGEQALPVGPFPGVLELWDLQTARIYDPDLYELTLRDGRVLVISQDRGLVRISDPNGNSLRFDDSGITHSAGKSITLTRDDEDRIVHVTDPSGNFQTYDYDARGDLVAHTDAEGNVSRFTYDDDHRLLSIEDPRGLTPIRNDYDADGRLIRHTDAFGKVIELTHDLASRQEVVTNRLGHSRLLEYDARGNVVREVDEMGKETVRTFDGRDNLLSERDPLGRTTTFTYSAEDDLLSQKDPLGNETTFTYNGRGQLLTVTDPRGGVTTSVYDAAGNLTSSTDDLGNVTGFAYDTAGNLLNTTDAAGEVTVFEYDAFGNQTKEIDALGHETVSTYDANGNRLTETRSRTLPDSSTQSLVTTFAYDALGRGTTTTAADGSSTSVGYDLLGKVTSRTDALGRVTSMTYDDMGRLVRTDHPDGTSESQSYDDEGRLVGQTDRGGRTTTFVYDAAGRLASTVFPGVATTSSTYDDAGQLVATTDARGNTASFVYDDAGRRTAVIDPLGNGPTFVYDANGNQTSVTDARGNTTTFTYDALNRLTTTTHPDGTTTRMGYDGLGRRFSETDQAGLTTTFGYDALGRLTSVTDALAQVTAYAYDEVGNRLTQTDANGHTTSFEYDRLGRQAARNFPDGSRETMGYNVDRTLASHTDFNGNARAFEYDDAQRLTRRGYPDGSEVTFTYTSTGQRDSVTDARGVTTYTYDDRDRLVEKTDPSGHRLGYAYDLQGNRTSLTATVGAQVLTTTYGYDRLNRLATVTDSQGGVTSLTYDANGNRASLAFPNSVTTDYTYDDLNQLTDLSTATGIGVVLQSYAYTLGAAGNRTRIDEHDGTSRHYVYDDLYRLTQDRVTDAAAALVYQRDFIYDPVGNRLEQTIEEGSGPTVVGSTYDGRDRLLTAAAASYGWDTNGNLTSRDGVIYGWDFGNRLTSVVLADGTVVETTYDADGNRVRTSVTPGGGGAATVVDYLVDTTGFLSHVVADVVGGSVQTLYARADDQLVGLFRPGSGVSRYYHADGLGSVRVLSDGLGGVTDRYLYTAFGELLEHTGSDLNPYRFAGEPFDPNTRFSYNRARWFDLDTGRSASADAFGGSVRQPVTLHRYLYANGDPVRMSDPSGLFVDGFGVATVMAGLTLSTSLAQIAPSAPIARTAKTGIFVQAHEVLVGRPGIGDSYHLSIKIVPRNQQKWISRHPKRFMIQGGSRVAFATLGAGPERLPSSGSLISDFNRPHDVHDSKAFIEKVGYGADEDKLIFYIMFIDAIYPDDQEYVLFPKPGKPGYNSNSYVAGILLAAGLQTPNFMLLHPELFPGAAKPLPLAQPGAKP